MKKGFTIVELLAVIVILGIIIAIAMPNVLNIIEKSRNDAIIRNENMLINVARKYFISNINLLPNNIGDTVELTVSTLKTNGLIESIKSPRNNQECNGYVLVTKIDNNYYDYSPQLNCIDNTRGSISSDGLIAYYRFDDFQEPTININTNPYFMDASANPTVVPYGSWGFGDHLNTLITSVSDAPAIGVGRSARVERTGSAGGATLVRGSMIHPALANGDKIATSWYVKGVGNSIGKSVSHVWGFCNGTLGAVSTGKLNEYTLTSEWQRIEFVYTWTRADMNSFANCLNAYVRVEGLNVGEHFLVSNPQVELKAHVTPFVEASRAATIKDHSFNNFDIPLQMDSTPKWSEDKASQGFYEFNGTTNFAMLPSISLTTSAVSIQLWTKLSKLPNELPNTFGGIFDSLSDHYIIYLDRSANELRFKVTTSISAERPGIPTNMLSRNEWLHITGTYDGTSARIYLNGNLVDTHNLTGVISGSQLAAFGRDGAAAFAYFEGAIDEVKIYNRALSASEIRQMYQSSLGRH